MDLPTYLNEKVPFREAVEFTITEAAAGHAEGYIEPEPEYSLRDDRFVAAAPVAFTLADAVGAAAVISKIDSLAPLIDMRVDYLRPATADLQATADVLRYGEDIAIADIVVRSADTTVTTARGAYKTGDLSADSPWSVDVSEQGDD